MCFSLGCKPLCLVLWLLHQLSGMLVAWTTWGFRVNTGNLRSCATSYCKTPICIWDNLITTFIKISLHWQVFFFFMWWSKSYYVIHNDIWHLHKELGVQKHSFIVEFGFWRSLLSVHYLLIIHYWQIQSCRIRRVAYKDYYFLQIIGCRSIRGKEFPVRCKKLILIITHIKKLLMKTSYVFCIYKLSEHMKLLGYVQKIFNKNACRYTELIALGVTAWRRCHLA